MKPHSQGGRQRRVTGAFRPRRSSRLRAP